MSDNKSENDQDYFERDWLFPLESMDTDFYAITAEEDRRYPYASLELSNGQTGTTIVFNYGNEKDFNDSIQALHKLKSVLGRMIRQIQLRYVDVAQKQREQEAAKEDKSIEYSQINEIKQRLRLFNASIDTDFEEWVCKEVGKYWHEDVPYLLEYIEKLDERKVEEAKEKANLEQMVIECSPAQKAFIERMAESLGLSIKDYLMKLVDDNVPVAGILPPGAGLNQH